MKTNDLDLGNLVNSSYRNVAYCFSFIIQAGCWLKQELDWQFLATGGQEAISNKSHKATFNVSVGTPGQTEWTLKEARANAVRALLSQTPGRIGAIEVSVSTQVAGQSNTVCAEYIVQKDVNNASVMKKNGFISIIHNQLEYVIQ